ncbi:MULTISPECIES: DUF2721 domain-containing protein [unclassified Alteromonas]|uniref:DUF2721 domain-containing protein n=1 Tax=unclassified Alteromonas TaxID=2614992 RepID=UPI000C6A4869|nr:MULTISPECIES: DUF2721 domain-containing protein [unclassified Alteromonas]AYA66119.1 DUF2721 domain-containing protein [Alteromonas sp. RKMC-009]MBT79569.1 hypothetical protein [Alteromonadaceae bacterium]MDO6474061.1 DUF2721 domain-containing protein [Alteromonas sp. 1_MG-2023]MEC7691737.1 DUF2721 domain-containing protein [Pseudomonadota bacterium]
MDTLITPLSELIKIAVAPVFLLAGIAGFLNVMSGRLGRISDRVRVAERNIQTFADAERIQKNKREIIMLWRRVGVINWAIGLCVTAGLLVCSVIVTLFSGELWRINLDTLVITLFILAMASLISALLVFLVEVRLATKTIEYTRNVH